MSIKITGSKTRVVDHLQERLDNFFNSSKSYNNARDKLDALAAQNVTLADIPAHEDRYQTLLPEYTTAVENLKYAAMRVEEKTDHSHIHKYFSRCKYIDGWHKETLKALHKVTDQILKTNYQAQISQIQTESQRRQKEAQVAIEFSLTESQRRQKEAQVAIEFSLIDQTFPSCSDKLIKENPAEYLRQAALYQNKLLEKKDNTAALAFGNSWIKNLPKETSWEQVETMSVSMLEAAKTIDNVDLTEYRAAVEQWLKEHPLHESPDSAQAISPWGRRTYVLGLLYLYNQKQELSPEAFQLYQTCSSLYPDQHSWKVAQAFYHISKLQWLEADQLLAGLPKDDDSVIKAQKCLVDNRLERIGAAGLDLGIIAFSRLVPSSYRQTLGFDIVQTSLQLLSNGVARKIWLPRLLTTSERSIPIRHLLLSSSVIIMAGDVIDFVFRNSVSSTYLQKTENFVSYTVRTANIAWTLYSNPQQRSLSSMMNLGSSLISVSQTYDDYRETRRPAALKALLATAQMVTSDLNATFTILSYSDLLPLIGIRPQQIASQVSATLLTAQNVSDLRQETQESSRDKWLFAAIGIGALATYRLYFDYPYLWAACVMKDAELYYSQGKYNDADRVLTEAKNSYFVSKAKPAVRDYANYVNWLKDYPKFLEDPAKCTEFLKHLDIALETLKAVSYYSGIRNNLLLKKMEIAIKQQDAQKLNEALKEGPTDKIVTLSFNFLLSYTFYLALKDQAAACSFLQEAGFSFPPRFHPITISLLKLLQVLSNSFEDWSQLNLLALLQNPLSVEKVKQWNDALQKLQSFFYKNLGKTGVCQDLQYYKLMISFAQTNNDEQIHALFKESDAELHQRFSYELVRGTRQLWKEGRHEEAINMLKKVRYTSFKDNKLIQNYEHFFSLLYPLPLQENSALEQMKALESCIADLDTKHAHHQVLHTFFCSWRIVLNLDGGEYANAKNLLVQEKTDSKVPAEVAALLFERIYVLMQENRVEKALSDLERIIKNLGSWQHLELFKAFQAYLSCEASLQVQLECLTSLITQVVPIEQLSNFEFNLRLRRHPLQFELSLLQGKLQEAKKLLTEPMPKEDYFKLGKLLFTFLINRGEELRQTVSLRKTRKTLQDLNHFFAFPHSSIVQSYVNFLVYLESAKESREITIHKKANQSLSNIFEELESIHRPIPASLKGEKAKILLDIGLFAKQAGQLKTALEAFESIKKLGIPLKGLDEDLDQFINYLKEQLHVPSKQGKKP